MGGLPHNNGMVDAGTNGIEIFADFAILKTEHIDAERLQESGAFLVVFQSSIGTVLYAVQFDR